MYFYSFPTLLWNVHPRLTWRVFSKNHMVIHFSKSGTKSWCNMSLAYPYPSTWCWGKLLKLKSPNSLDKVIAYISAATNIFNPNRSTMYVSAGYCRAVPSAHLVPVEHYCSLSMAKLHVGIPFTKYLSRPTWTPLIFLASSLVRA